MAGSAKDANRAFFEDAYSTGVHGWGVTEPSPYAVDYLEHVGKCLPGCALLDAGCGEGRHSFAAARLGFRVTGVDFEPLALKRARLFAAEQGLPDVTFRRADILRLPFAAGAFGAVLDYGCLHHQRKCDWPLYKSNLLRVLSAGGFYIVSVFSPRFRMFKGSRRRWHIAQGAYRRCFTRDELFELFGGEFEFLAVAEELGSNGGFHHCLMMRRDEG